jgi:hypothetical protein
LKYIKEKAKEVKKQKRKKKLELNKIKARKRGYFS